jgi:hypothetical protein
LFKKGDYSEQRAQKSIAGWFCEFVWRGLNSWKLYHPVFSAAEGAAGGNGNVTILVLNSYTAIKICRNAAERRG